MKAFKFSLEKLLETKQAMEQALEGKLRDATSRLDQCRGELKGLKVELEKKIRDIEKLNGNKTCMSELTLYSGYEKWMREQIDAQLRLIDEQSAIVEEIRSDLMVIMQDRKSIEKLREKERKSWLLEQNRNEQKATDEISVSSFIRNRKTA